MANTNLSSAKNAKNDEFYTQYHDIEKETFDGIWAYTSLLHVPKSEIEKPLLEIRRVLKNDGIFGLGMIEGKTEGYRESSGVNMPRWFSFYEKPEIEK